MITRDAEPTGNRNPLPRIKIGSDAGQPVDQRAIREASSATSKAEAERIWGLTVHAASGKPVEPAAPPPAEDEIDWTGLWGGFGYGY